MRPGFVEQAQRNNDRHELLFKNRPVRDIFEMQPKLVDLWPDGADRDHLYGRPLAFYQQLQKLNLAAAWSQVKVPTLVVHGEFDWIMRGL